MNPPAFQLYADDFLAGTSDMTAEEVGVYIRLLCHSWNKNGLENDEKRLGLLAGQCHGIAAAEALQVLGRKFELAPDGKWRNARQEVTRQNLILYREKQAQKAHLRWDRAGRVAGPKTDAVAQPGDMPRECSPSPSPSPLQERERTPAPERHFPEAVIPNWAEVKQMAEMSAIPESIAREFFDHYEANNLWANKHGAPVNVRGSLIVWFNRSKKINGNRSQPHRQSPDRNAGTFNANTSTDGAKAKIR